MTMQAIEQRLNKIKEQTRKDNPLRDILTKVCEEFQVTPRQMQNKSRFQRYVNARKAFCYLAIQKYHTSTSTARMICRDHSTVLYHALDTPGLMQYDDEMRVKINALQESLSSFSLESYGIADMEVKKQEHDWR